MIIKTLTSKCSHLTSKLFLLTHLLTQILDSNNVEDSTINEDTTAPSGEASLGAHVSETNQATFPPPCTMEQILEAHPIDDTFWENTNPTDVQIDTVNSEEQMAGSHITKFHTPEDKEIAPEGLLSQINQHFDNQHD